MNVPARIALATCRELPEVDSDEPLLLDALRARGADVRMLAWDDPREHEPRPGELVVVRSTWNYYRELDAFLRWLDGAARRSRVLNPAHVVRANARKTYLRDLAEAGVDVVPTAFVGKGARASLEAFLRARDWGRVVIKPVVSAGSFGTRSFGRDEGAAAQAFLDELTAERDAIVQRWIPSVDTYGERSLVWIDGALTHAVRKVARFAGATHAIVEPRPVAPEERAFAERVVAPLAGDLLYARVDVVWDTPDGEPPPADGAPPRGTLRLMELELIEPSLFLAEHPPALDRLAGAILRHAALGVA